MANKESMIHYRTGGKLTHCGVEILPNGQDIPCIYIKSIKFHESHEVAGRSIDNVWIATFEPNPYTTLPMVLNSTNRVRLSKLAREPYLERISNFPVRLTQEDAKDVKNGGTTKGLRISKTKATIPVQPKKEVLTLEHENFVKSVKYLQDGGNMDALRARYEISKEVEDELRKG